MGLSRSDYKAEKLPLFKIILISVKVPVKKLRSSDNNL